MSVETTALIAKPIRAAHSCVVVNLATGQEVEYGGPTPQQAVVNAYEQFTRGNWNTWEYDYSQAKLTPSGLHWNCGDWTCRS